VPPLQPPPATATSSSRQSRPRPRRPSLQSRPRQRCVPAAHLSHLFLSLALLTRRRSVGCRLSCLLARSLFMAMVDEGGKREAQPPGLDPRTRRSAVTRATGDMDGGGRGEEWEGPPGYVLSLSAAELPLPIAVSCLDATVRRKGRSHIRHRGHPSGWWAFRLPIPAPEEAKEPVPPSSAANNPTEEGRSCPLHQRLPVRQAPPPRPPVHTLPRLQRRGQRRGSGCACSAARR
jgi:hypothetical protein